MSPYRSEARPPTCAAHPFTSGAFVTWVWATIAAVAMGRLVLTALGGRSGVDDVVATAVVVRGLTRVVQDLRQRRGTSRRRASPVEARDG